MFVLVCYVQFYDGFCRGVLFCFFMDEKIKILRVRSLCSYYIEKSSKDEVEFVFVDF